MKCGCTSHNGFLTERGIELAEQTSLEGLDPLGVPEYVDRVGSVSGLELERDLYAFVDDVQLDQQYRRFLNGS